MPSNRLDTTSDTNYTIAGVNRKMSTWEKFLQRIRTLSKDLRFDELLKVLESCGYQMFAPRSGSSHYTFRKPGCHPITIPKHEPMKRIYVEMVRDLVESEAIDHENN